MTESRDWLSDLLDRHPGEAVPPEFQVRLMSRIRSEVQTLPAPIHRWPLRLAAAAGVLAVLGLGYWLGMGAPSLRQPQRIETPGDTAALEIEEIWRNRELLDSWEMIHDPDLQIGIAESISGAAVLEEPR
jgi:hypothetical protein